MLLRRQWHSLSRRTAISPYKTAALFLSTLTILWLLLSATRKATPVGPLTLRHVQREHRVGGRAYIPPSWLPHTDAPGLEHTLPGSSVLESAEYASAFANQHHAVLNSSQIPLIIHQVLLSNGRPLDADRWLNVVKRGVEQWLGVAVGGENRDEHLRGPEMAWILWDDDGVDALIKRYEPKLYQEYFQRLPYLVEKADVFRVVVLKWLGGVYADLDTEPLKHPFGWIYDSDLSPWTEVSPDGSQVLHKPTQQAPEHPSNSTATLQPVINAIVGIEGDNPPEPNPTYWRKGYTFPVQLTNWAFAMAPHHSIADHYLGRLRSAVLLKNELRAVDPLNITGPPAFTAAVMSAVAELDEGLCWDALSGLNDPEGGRGKTVAGNTLVLPITGFHPGGQRSMGSQSVTHINARLQHAAVGSWRKPSLKVEYGRLCRVLFGYCRDWSKISPDI